MRRDALRNQELVLAAARTVLSELGTEASMEQVASQAGVGVGTVYRGFPNKEALIDELVRIMIDDLVIAARGALLRSDGTGLEVFLRALGESFVAHRGLADKLVGRIKADAGVVLNQLMAELLAQAKEHHRIGRQVTMGDLKAITWALRGVVEATAAVAPDTWQRFLDIHLAGLRTEALPSSRPSLTEAELATIAELRSSRR
jgi:AcrR family transcriptional regulator